ncbi:hypothetical protein [Xanthomonas sp. 1678]|uniref:hypothetical protein n=1 Tax=Xanthomonas sp. 1678 TaxID=3158788 RepID=UPI00285F1537|nr:hypothetical protein [Xanthomonas translucens]
MSSSIFEISLKDKFLFSDVANALLECLNKKVCGVVSDSIYWGLPLEQQINSVGLEVILSEIGYKTLVNGVCLFDLYGESLGKLAACISVKLKTEVVIGDCIKDTGLVTGRYLVFYPDGSFKNAYESVNDGDSFDVVVVE